MRDFGKLFYPPFSALLTRGDFMKAKPDRTLDCLGLYCPEPVFKTRMEIDELKVGETLEVLADDPAAGPDIESLVKHLGQEVLSVSKEGNAVRVLIKKLK
jgi:TusA-related sulfurtransferase